MTSPNRDNGPGIVLLAIECAIAVVGVVVAAALLQQMFSVAVCGWVVVMMLPFYTEENICREIETSLYSRVKSFTRV